MHAAVTLGPDGLSIADVARVARGPAALVIDPSVRERIERARRRVDRLVAEGRRVYGVTTGVGALADRPIDPADQRELSRRIVISHAAGVGDPLPREAVRAVMTCALAMTARGHAGVRWTVVDALRALLDAGVTPRVPSRGSLGYLTYMAHIACVLIGEGEAEVAGEVLPAEAALHRAGLSPLTLEAKEGLSLVSGTPGATGLAALAVHDATRLVAWADATAALTLEALGGQHRVFDARVHAARGHGGQMQAAAHGRALLAGSTMLDVDDRVQDALSLRAIPQVHGAVRDHLDHARATVATELNAATDNPLIVEDGGEPEALPGANPHGAPLALAMETLTAAAAQAAGLAERRIYRLVTAAASGLPAFLAPNRGLDSGLMMPHCTAASLVADNKVLAHPVATDSIPTSGLQEDHVSFATSAAAKARTVVANAEHVLAIELLTAARAHDVRAGGSRGAGTDAAYRALRARVPPLDTDRRQDDDIAAARAVLTDDAALDAVEAAAGHA